jgi:hypothetical protein
MSSQQRMSPSAFMAAAPTLPNGNTAFASAYAHELHEIINRQAHRQPRNMQSHLGPSEIGDQCDRKVVGKLAGEPVTNHVVDPWASIVGTAVHAWLAEKFGLENQLNQFAFPRWLTEVRVTPHPSYPGTADLYDAAYKSVVDWKILGPTSMAKVRRPEGPPVHYQVQLLLYALGYRNMGLPVERVMLAALPRTEPTLDAMYVWEHQYSATDDVVIEAVLGKTAIRRQIADEVLGRRIPITAVPITPSDDGCFFCPFYRPQSARDGGPGCPGHSPLR